MSAEYEATEGEQGQKKDGHCPQNDNHSVHAPKASSFALLFLLIVTSAFFAAPFEAIEGELLRGNPAVRPGVTLFAAGALIGIALDSMPPRRITNVLRKSKANLVLCAIIAVALIAPMSIDWLSMLFFNDASQSHGFFGTGPFVYSRNLLWIISPALEILAGYLTVNLLLNTGAIFSMIDSPLRPTMDNPKARVLLCWTVMVWGLLVRQTTAMAYEYAAVPISSLLALIICIAIFALPLIALRALYRSDKPCHLAPSTSFPSLLIGSFSIGVIIWGALVRVAHVSILAHPGFTLLLTATSLFCVFLLTQQTRRIPAETQEDCDGGKAQHETRDRLFQEAGLAPREAEIAQLFADGRTSGEIANQLSIKPATVRSALQRSYKKLGVGNKNEFMSLLNTESKTTPIKTNMSDAPNASAQNDATPETLLPGWAMVLIILVAFACVIPAATDMQTWGAYRPWLYGMALAASAGGMTYITLQLKGGESTNTNDAPFTIITALYLGFAWEETLRLATPYGLRDVTLPFLIVITCVSVTASSNRSILNGYGNRAAAALSVGILTMLACLIWRPSLFAISAYAFCALLYQMSNHSMLNPTHIGACTIAFGLSAIASDVLVNKYGDYIFGNDGFTSPLGGRQSFAMLCFIYAILAGTIAVAACVLLMRSIRAHSLSTNMGASGFDVDGRAWHYLMGCGLNETQASVLLMIAKGANSQQISDTLGYSRGSINGARHVGYTRLRVHDRLGLIELLSQVDSL